MIKRYDQHHKDHYDLVEHETGNWVKWEDVQQACIESYNAGAEETMASVQRALGIKDE
jgi:hypothetical protein